MKIVLTKRPEDWHAHLTEHGRGSDRGYWGCGKTQNAAITDLVLTHFQVTRVQIHVFKLNEIDFVAELPFDRLKWEAARSQSDAVGKLVRSYMQDFDIDAIELSDDEYTQKYFRRFMSNTEQNPHT